MMLLKGGCLDLHPVDAEEVPALLDVYRQCEDFLALGPVPTASVEMVRADLDLSHNEGGVFCGIYRCDDHRMIGVVDFVPSGWQGDPATAYLSLLMVAAPYRGHGLGASVVALVEAELLRDGTIRKIEAGVQVNNPGAIRFWQRMGYRIISEPQQMPDGTTVFRLEKAVQKGELTET